MKTIDISKLRSVKKQIKLGGRVVYIGDPKSVDSTDGGTTEQVLKALKRFGKLELFKKDEYVSSQR